MIITFDPLVESCTSSRPTSNNLLLCNISTFFKSFFSAFFPSLPSMVLCFSRYILLKCIHCACWKVRRQCVKAKTKKAVVTSRWSVNSLSSRDHRIYCFLRGKKMKFRANSKITLYWYPWRKVLGQMKFFKNNGKFFKTFNVKY